MQDTTYSNQQAAGYPSQPYPAEAPRSAQLLATVNANIETIANIVDALAGRVIGPREAANSGGARGIPATYGALAEDLGKRTGEIIERLQQITGEI
jgi:hypothetical protein